MTFFRKFTIHSGIKITYAILQKGQASPKRSLGDNHEAYRAYIVSVLCALTLAVFMSIAVSAWDDDISVKVFGTKYSADSTDSPTDSYSVEYKDDAIVITLKSLNETITAPFIESTSETPITVKLNGSSAITAHKSTNADFTFIKSRGAVTITPENNNSELTIVPAVSGQQLAAGGGVTNNAVVNFKCPDDAGADGISFELGADFTIAANSTITLDNNFTLVVDGTEFTAASAPSGTSSRIRCAGEGPCHGIIDIKGSAKAVFNGNIETKNKR